MSWLFASDGQSIGASASISVLAMKYLGLISFRIGWFDLLAVQGTQESSPKGNPLTLLVGMQTSTATMENSVEIP